MQDALLLLDFFVVLANHLVQTLYLPLEGRIEVVFNVVIAALLEAPRLQHAS